MAVLGELVRRTGRIGPDQDLDALDQLNRDLRQRTVDHRDVIGGGIRAGVPRPEHRAERFPGLVRVHVQRVEPVPMLVVPGRLLLLRMRGDQRRVHVDRQPLRRTNKLPEPRPRPRVRIPDSVQQPRRGGDPVDRPERGRVRRHRSEQRVLITGRAQVRQALAAIGEHHREIADHPARVMTATPLLEPRQTHRERTREPDLVRDLPEQRGPRVLDTSPAPSDVTSTVTGRPSRITFKVKPPSSGFRTSATQESPLSPDDSAPPNPGGAGLTARSGLVGRVCVDSPRPQGPPDLPRAELRRHRGTSGRDGDARQGDRRGEGRPARPRANEHQHGLETPRPQAHAADRRPEQGHSRRQGPRRRDAAMASRDGPVRRTTDHPGRAAVCFRPPRRSIIPGDRPRTVHRPSDRGGIAASPRRPARPKFPLVR